MDYASSGHTIKNCRMNGFWAGIYGQWSSGHNEFLNNIISNTIGDYAIDSNGANSNNLISGNSITNSPGVRVIGGGTGNIAKSMIDLGYNVSLGEMHLKGIEFAKSYGVQNLFQFDLLKSPFVEHFDAITMFDVIEHIEDDAFALKKCRKALISDGIIFITVPAFELLWSRIDTESGHKRRYSKALFCAIKKSDFSDLSANLAD